MPEHPQLPSDLYGEIASATARIAWRLVVRYAPLYAAVAVLLVVAVVAPSRVNASRGSESPMSASSTAGGLALEPTTPSGTPVPPSSLSPESSSAISPPSPTNSSSDPVNSAPDADPTATPSGKPENLNSGPPPCPLTFGEDPEVSRNVAGALLGAASPVLSLLGPLGPNAVPALGVASPVLPIVAPVADVFSGYIRLFNPLFLQISGAATTLWDGPLAPLEGPLLDLNAKYIQPFEVELLAQLSPVLEGTNATPITPCLQRVVYNVIAPLPIPKAPRP